MAAAVSTSRWRKSRSPAGCTPDTISSDIHVFSGNSPGMPYLPNVMSKFMAMGFSLEQVVAMATTAPAKIINRAPKIGTLQIGAPGDVAIMDLVEGPVTFVDTRNNKRDGKVQLKPVQTVINGVPFGRPYQAPFCGEVSDTEPNQSGRAYARFSTLPIRVGTPNSLRHTSASVAMPSRICRCVGLAKHSRSRQPA